MCGPVDRGLDLVVGSYVLLDRGDQLFDTGEAATPDRPLGDDPKPTFHLVRTQADFVYSQEASVGVE